MFTYIELSFLNVQYVPFRSIFLTFLYIKKTYFYQQFIFPYLYRKEIVKHYKTNFRIKTSQLWPQLFSKIILLWRETSKQRSIFFVFTFGCRVKPDFYGYLPKLSVHFSPKGFIMTRSLALFDYSKNYLSQLHM